MEQENTFLLTPCPQLIANNTSPQSAHEISSSSEPMTSATSDASQPLSSPALPPMSPLDPGHEGDLSVSLLQLKVDNKPDASSDSFSSQPDSTFNKGALAFIGLLEAAIASKEA